MFQAIYNAPVPSGVYTTTWKVRLSMDFNSGGIWLREARLVQMGWWSSTWGLTHNSSHRPSRHVAALWYKLFSTQFLTSWYEILRFSAVENADGTPEFRWEEPQPNSEEATRLCGTKSPFTLELFNSVCPSFPRPSCSRGTFGRGFHICDTAAGKCWTNQRWVSNRAQRGTLRLHCNLHRSVDIGF